MFGKRLKIYRILFAGIVGISAYFVSGESVKSEFIPITNGSPAFAEKLVGLPKGAKNFNVDLPNPKKELVVNAADFGLDEKAENCATIINKALAHCKKVGASKLVLPKGVYKIFEEVSIDMEGFEDFVLDGQGSVLVYRKETVCNMNVNKCKRIEICNLNFDWDWDNVPLASLVKIVNTNVDGFDNSYVDFEFLEYDDFPNKDTRFVMVSPWDMKNDCCGGEDGANEFWNNPHGPKMPSKIEWLKPNLVRVHPAKNAWGNWRGYNNLPKNVPLRMQHFLYQMGGMVMRDNEHMTLRNVDVYSCAGMAFIVAGKQKYTQFLDVNVKRPDGVKRRTITCTADHLHLVSSCGFLKIKNCEFSLGGDDCINMHDCSVFSRPTGEHSVKTQRGWVVKSFSVGDEIEFRYADDLSPTGSKIKLAKIVPIKPEIGEYELVFDEKIPAQKKDGFVLFNWAFNTHNVIIDGCKFGGNRARGVLVLARDVTIKNSSFYHMEGGAIKIESGYTYNEWSEGYGARNIVVKNCKFEKASSTYAQRDINLNVYLKTDPSAGGTKYPVLNDILFEDNTFVDTFGYLAYITSAGNVIFRNNTIVQRTERKDRRIFRGTFYVAYASNVKIINNKFVASDMANTGVYYDPKTVSNLTVQGNYITTP